MGKPSTHPPQTKIAVTSKSPVGDISVVTLIRTDTTLDHGQKAKKVCCQISICPRAIVNPRVTRLAVIINVVKSNHGLVGHTIRETSHLRATVVL